jgi:hypothetical protein
VGIFDKIVDTADKGIAVVNKTVINQDEAMQLKSDIISKMTEYMFTGSGSSITKYTICGLVTVIVLAGAFVFLVKPTLISLYKDYAITVLPIIGLLTGTYAAATTVQRITKR